MLAYMFVRAYILHPSAQQWGGPNAFKFSLRAFE